MTAATYPQVSLVQPPTGRDADVRVLVHFTKRAVPFASSPTEPGVRYGRELASCRAVITAAVREGNCAQATRVINFKRRRGLTRVMVVSEYAPGQSAIRTGLSRNKDHCWAAAEACLAALLALPAPDPKSVGLRIRL